MASQTTMNTEMNSSNVSGMDNISKILNKNVDLITNSNIRYEGVLIKIKTEDKRLLLKDVKSFGTEGRNNGINEVPTPPIDDPNNLYTFVEFQIPLIKELYLTKLPDPVLEDPAIISVKHEEVQNIKPEIKEEGEEELQKFKPNPADNPDLRIPHSNHFFDDDNHELEEEYHPRGYRGGNRRGRGQGRGGYRGGYYNNRGNRGGRGRYNQHGKFEKNPNFHLQEKFKDDFFSKSIALEDENKEIPKEENENSTEEVKEQIESENRNEEKDIQTPTEEQPVVTSTAGDGFFDDFVDSDQNEEGHRGRGDRYYNLNLIILLML